MMRESHRPNRNALDAKYDSARRELLNIEAKDRETIKQIIARIMPLLNSSKLKDKFEDLRPESAIMFKADDMRTTQTRMPSPTLRNKENNQLRLLNEIISSLSKDIQTEVYKLLQVIVGIDAKWAKIRHERPWLT